MLDRARGAPEFCLPTVGVLRGLLAGRAVLAVQWRTFKFPAALPVQARRTPHPPIDMSRRIRAPPQAGPSLPAQPGNAAAPAAAAALEPLPVCP
jgi:hypothetical protein